MSAVASFAPLTARPAVSARKSMRATPVASRTVAPKVAMTKKVVCKSEQTVEVKKVQAAVSAAAVAIAASPEIAQAADLTPSLNALLGSVVAGGIVLGGIAGAVIAVSNFDQVNR
eukprot:CAMPEP_0197851852 /NCGR_PEP_ID=MMETSP1438-20131217/19031_1 /TAXON_ID=1461541 /ORGANISM="Pterosperma sp., Strain CCMP1384" /LENGTH=114 /DNA_ID=CAMNT_0043465611 /DNA_START=97 /DNA_END=441 /DNA_ORIENTATION=+